MFKGLRKKYNINEIEWSWIKYDIANSAFILTVVTVLFPLLNSLVAEENGIDPIVRGASFSFLISALSLFIAVISPFLGAIANYKGFKMKFFKFFVIIGALAGIALAFPTWGFVSLNIMYAVAYVCYGSANIFYDAFLVDVCEDEDRQDQLSSYGFSFGYIGSMIPFVIGIIPYALQFMSLVRFDEMFGISEYTALRICFSLAFLIASVWWLVLSKDMFKNVKQTYEIQTEGNLVKEAFMNILATAKDIKKYKNIFIYLIAYVLYMDVTSGLIKTVNNIAPDLGIGVISMLIVIIIIQLVAFPFAIIYGNLAKKIGAKKMIYVGMAIYFIVIFIAYNMTAETSYLIYILGFMVGMAQGGIQAVSRSYFARLVPREKANEFFGFFGIFSKFTGIISPALYGAILLATESVNTAILAFYVPLILGAIVFFFVKDEKVKL